MRERKREREKFSRAIKHYRTSRVRLIKSAASTTAAHREERNHYQEKKGFAIELYSFRGETNGTWKTKKRKMAEEKDTSPLGNKNGNERDEKRGKLIKKNGTAMANDNETLILEFKAISLYRIVYNQTQSNFKGRIENKRTFANISL